MQQVRVNWAKPFGWVCAAAPAALRSLFRPPELPARLAGTATQATRSVSASVDRPWLSAR
jgi:hypothetical protein